MSHWEEAGKSDDWYTPKYIFDALGCQFDLDVAAPADGKGTHVPAAAFLHERGLEAGWSGFVWMNPPFGGRNKIWQWLEKFFRHGNGIALAPDRTSAPWFQAHSRQAAAILFLSPKVKFEKPNGELGASPSTGTALFAAGDRATATLLRARRLGLLVLPT